MSAEGRVRPVHLAGSVPLSDAEAVMRACATGLKTAGGESLLQRFSDGECGKRSVWIVFQYPIMMASGVLVQSDKELSLPNTPALTLAEGKTIEDLSFANLEYADEAIRSYKVFKSLKDEGVLPKDARFQVSLPTALAVCLCFCSKENGLLLQVERVYQEALSAEVRRICDAIPHEELAIQWDWAVEMLFFDPEQKGFPIEALGMTFDDIIDRFVKYSSDVPEGVKLGIHLCYGDIDHKHFQDPSSIGPAVQLASKLSSVVAERKQHPISWIMIPVPHVHTDNEAFFEPLKDLDVTEEITVFIGLIHFRDGIEGAKTRIGHTEKHLPEKFHSTYGVCTECGWGRREPETIPDLISLHADVAVLGS